MIGLSALRDRVFRQDLSDPLERLLRRSLRRHSLSEDVGRGEAPDLLGFDLGIAWVVNGILRDRRAEQALPGVSRQVLILGIEPEGVVLGEFRHCWKPSAQSAFQVGVRPLRRDQAFPKIFGTFYVLDALA